jgi:hypothetical protein
MNSQQKTAAILFAVVFIIILTLYLVTLAPGVVGGDAGEHQLAVPLLGIPHTTGYPLYVLVGYLWTQILPLGSMAWRMNLFSAMGGALAAAITALVVFSLPVTVKDSQPAASTWPGGVLAAVILATGLTLWQWSTIAGVRSFNIFFFSLLTLLAFIWAKQRQQRPAAAERTLYWLALTVGLSLTHHRTTVFYLPSLVGWIAWHEPRILKQPVRILKLVVLTLIPLLLYGFIYWRGTNNPPYTHEPIYDWQSFWFLVGSGDSTGLFLSIDPAFLPARLYFIWLDLLQQVAWPGLVLTIIGSGLLLWKRTAHFIFLAVLVVLLLLFTLDFEVVNLDEAPTWYLMPAYFVVAVWAGVGVNGLFEIGMALYASRFKPEARPALKTLFAVQLIYTVFLLATVGYFLTRPNWQSQFQVVTSPLDDWRQQLRGTQAQRFVESSLPFVEPESIIWGDWEQYTPLVYYQLINGIRSDVTVRNPLNEWPQKVAEAHAAGQPIYFTRKPTDLIGTPFLSMVGPLIRIGTAPEFNLPAGITPLDVNFEDELELIGYRAAIRSQARYSGLATGPILQITIYWRVPAPASRDYALSLRLVDARGQEIYRKDAAHPVLSSYPTTLWQPGEVVGDFYELLLPADGGPVTLQLLPYRTEGPGQWYNLTPEGAEQSGIMLGPFGQ